MAASRKSLARVGTTLPGLVLSLPAAARAAGLPLAVEVRNLGSSVMRPPGQEGKSLSRAKPGTLFPSVWAFPRVEATLFAFSRGYNSRRDWLSGFASWFVNLFVCRGWFPCCCSFWNLQAKSAALH